MVRSSLLSSTTVRLSRSIQRRIVYLKVQDDGTQVVPRNHDPFGNADAGVWSMDYRTFLGRVCSEHVVLVQGGLCAPVVRLPRILWTNGQKILQRPKHKIPYFLPHLQ